MRLKAILSGLASMLVVAAPVTAQQTDDVFYRQSPPPVSVPWPEAQWRGPVLPLLANILRQRAALGLSSDQAQNIERIAFERIDGNLEVARLRAIEAGKAQLNAEQRAKLGRLLAGDDPSGFFVVAQAAAQPGGGGAPGEPGGGGTHPGGDGTHGHPGVGGAPGHPGGGGDRPPGGVPGHPPGGRPPVHHPGRHPGVPGGVYTEPYVPPPPPPLYWYYCPAYGAYYPNVLSCPEWLLIPAL